MRRVADIATDTVARGLRGVADLIRSVPMLSGRALVAVTLTSGSAVKLRHGLGRRWRGYHITAQLNDSGTGTIWTTRTAEDGDFLVLNASGFTENPQIELWIY